RVIPVIKELAAKIKTPISLDTSKPSVARAGIAAGASIINDVMANRTDSEMWKLVAETGTGYVCMHMQGTPRTMQKHPFYRNVVRDVQKFFIDRIKRLRGCGIAPE